MTLKVRQGNCFGDCSVIIELVLKGQSHVLLRKSDCVVQFAHAAWSGTQVAVFVDGTLCFTLQVAYDTALSKTVDFAAAQSWLKGDMMKMYSLTPDQLKQSDGDTFKWATNPGGHAAWLLRYHSYSY